MSEDNMPTTNSKSNMLSVIGVVIVAAIVGFVMIRSNASTTTPESEETMMEETHEEDAMMEGEEAMEDEDDAMMADEAMEGVVMVTGEAGGFYFDPDTIEAKLGDTVKVELTVVDGTHDFVLDEFEVQSEVMGAGETILVEFVADQVGEFEYYCSVGNHRQLGMVGTLTVTE